MIIVNLKGGLGNQMFQYAFAYCLAKKNKTKVACDLRFLEENRGRKNYVTRAFDLWIFGIKPFQPSKLNLLRVGMLFGDWKLRYLLGRLMDRVQALVLCERSISFEERVFQRQSRDIYVDGYWQSEKYFCEYEADIKDLFQLNENKFDEKVILFKKMIINKKNAVCVNVRRGDFVGSKYHDVIDKDYYLKALKILAKKVESPLCIYIFSDDVEWCRNHLADISDQVSIVGHEYAGESFSAYLYLMTQFSMFIIPNSTFAWWAAWLSPFKDKIVIAPRVWSGIPSMENGDIVPCGWITV